MPVGRPAGRRGPRRWQGLTKVAPAPAPAPCGFKEHWPGRNLGAGKTAAAWLAHRKRMDVAA